jgi:hypothetical protein
LKAKSIKNEDEGKGVRGKKKGILWGVQVMSEYAQVRSTVRADVFARHLLHLQTRRRQNYAVKTSPKIRVSFKYNYF